MQMKPREGSRADQRRPRFPWRRSDDGSDLPWEREKHEEGQNRGCSGSTELAIVVARRSWHGSLCRKAYRELTAEPRALDCEICVVRREFLGRSTRRCPT